MVSVYMLYMWVWGVFWRTLPLPLSTHWPHGKNPYYPACSISSAFYNIALYILHMDLRTLSLGVSCGNGWTTLLLYNTPGAQCERVGSSFGVEIFFDPPFKDFYLRASQVTPLFVINLFPLYIRIYEIVN